MPETDPIEVLMDEHRIIERVLAAVEMRLDSATEGPFCADLFEQAIDFVRNFADGCHHLKEEQILFPELERRGIPREGGPIGVMLTEHDLGRSLIRTAEARVPAARQGDQEAAREVVVNLRQFVQLLRDHIFKEDNVLFPMARQVLRKEDWANVSERFEQTESPDHERYVEWARSL